MNRNSVNSDTGITWKVSSYSEIQSQQKSSDLTGVEHGPGIQILSSSLDDFDPRMRTIIEKKG